MGTEAQHQIPFSGIVLDYQTLDPISHVLIRNASQSTHVLSDTLGTFYLLANVGDSIYFEDSRYRDVVLYVPVVMDAKPYGLVQLLVPDMVVLEEVIVTPFPSEEVFLQSIVSYIPPARKEDAYQVKREIMEQIRDLYTEDQFYYKMWSYRRFYELTGEIPPNDFINPIAWTNFIQAMKQYRNEKK